MASLILLLAMFVLLWVLLIRPQRQRQQKQQHLLSSVEPGDEVLTVGGLYGIVRDIDEEDDLIVEIAEGIQVRIARRAVGGVVKPEDEDDDVAGPAWAGVVPVREVYDAPLAAPDLRGGAAFGLSDAALQIVLATAEAGKGLAARCAGCGELEGSSYAKHCCSDDNMIDDGGEDE